MARLADSADRDGPPTHHYSATCSWSGSTGVGYERYSREHAGHAAPAGATVRMSSDPAFRGDPALLNPEQLVALSASSCQLLSFLAVAARARIDVRDYQDTAKAIMVEDGRGGGAITQIVLRPRIVVVTDATEQRLRALADLAHRQCFIAASLSCPVTVIPTFEVLTPYAFRDTEAAARRLALVADVFDPGSRAFVHDQVAARGQSNVRLAVDLGCGPGHTTRLLGAATGAARTVGLDTSAAFLATARAAAGDAAGPTGDLGLEFVRHDVRRVPFPARASGADVGYARLLLAHLADVPTVIGGWLGQVAPGGVLLLDEAESIETDQPALASYLDHAARLLAARGALLYAGGVLEPALGDLATRESTPPFQVDHNSTDQVSPPVSVAAAMFTLNLAVWRADPLFRDRQPELDRLAADLDMLARAPEHTGRITWTMRRVALRRLVTDRPSPASAPTSAD